jgi:hypothetical protein
MGQNQPSWAFERETQIGKSEKILAFPAAFWGIWFCSAQMPRVTENKTPLPPYPATRPAI